MPNQPPVKSVPEFVPRDKLVEFKNDWGYIFSPSVRLHGVENFFFYFKRERLFNY
jgi:hypothetical protein